MWITKRLISISIDVGIQNDCIDVREERRRKSGLEEAGVGVTATGPAGKARGAHRGTLEVVGPTTEDGESRVVIVEKKW
jgi:hypothetical protein